MADAGTGPLRSIGGSANDPAPVKPLPAIAAEGPFAFRGRRVLMLQGPVGPFFARLATDLRWAGAQVHKVNFNGGDWLFQAHDSTCFRDPLDVLPAFLDKLCDELRIDVIMLFGDCRPHHRLAAEVAERRGIRLEVFEEGYIRPDYVTMETHGVNGHSALPRSSLFYLNTPVPNPPPALPVGRSFGMGALWATFYYAAAVLAAPLFRHYRHHRSLSWFEALLWLRGLIRKMWYGWRESSTTEELVAPGARPFFLVPLQVHNDAQIRVHSPFTGVADFIRHVARSFADDAPPDARLVFKHHPMDRAYVSYARLMRRLARDLGLGDRLIYVHDLHLPTLLEASRGVVTINSTTGLSALHHGRPVIALGDAVYRVEGLTYGGTLASFWRQAEATPPHHELYLRFRDQIIYRTQINGNFYRRLDVPGSAAGLNWLRGEA